MNQFNHIYPPVPKHSSFTIKVKEEKAKTTNILDESAKKPSRSWIFSLVSHSILLLGMVLIGLDSPQITKAIVIEMSSISKEEELSFDEIAGVTLDDLAEMDIDVGEMMETDLALSPLPDFEPPPLSPMIDKILQPENQAGTNKLSDFNPSDLMTNLAPERSGMNNDMMDVGNPLFSGVEGNGMGGEGLSGDIQRLASYGAKKGLVTVSLIWNTRDDLDLHLVRDARLPRLGTYNFQDMVYYAKRTNKWGHLDIDMNVFPDTDKPVEKIYMSDYHPGRYGVYIHLYRSHTRAKEIKFRVIIQREGSENPKVIDSVVRYPQHNINSLRVADYKLK